MQYLEKNLKEQKTNRPLPLSRARSSSSSGGGRRGGGGAGARLDVPAGVGPALGEDAAPAKQYRYLAWDGQCGRLSQCTFPSRGWRSPARRRWRSTDSAPSRSTILVVSSHN